MSEGDISWCVMLPMISQIEPIREEYSPGRPIKAWVGVFISSLTFVVWEEQVLVTENQLLKQTGDHGDIACR